MTRVVGCLVVLLAIAMAWLGCREDLDIEDQFLGGGTGTGSDIPDAPVDTPQEGGGSDAPDAPVDVLPSVDAAIDAGSGVIDAAVDAGVIDGPRDGGGGGDNDGGGGGGNDGGAGNDAAGALDGGPGSDFDPLDRTSFYACAGAGCGSSAGAEVWLPIVIALGFAVRRRRRTPA